MGQSPSYEDERVLRLPNAPDLLREARGGALKIIDPLRFRPPKGDYRCVWLARDAGQQAKSMAKFLASVMGLQTGRRDLKALESSLRKDYPRGLSCVRSLGPTLELSFERVLADPRVAAALMASHIDAAFDVDAAAGSVMRREPACLDYMLEAVEEAQECHTKK